MSVEVIIPAYKPDSGLIHLVSMLHKQLIKPDRIRIVLTSDSVREAESLQKTFGDRAIVERVPKSAFSHGGTRQKAIDTSTADHVLFMTQDALPADTKLITYLLEAVSKPRTAVAYARQIAYGTSGDVEKFSRRFNYPSKSHTQTEEDLTRIGVKAVFCSDTCAMYDRRRHIEAGGFDRGADFGEDAVFAYNALIKGMNVEYCAEAKVYHSHDYDLKEQFKRSVMIAVSQKRHPEIYGSLKSESEGMRYLKTGLRFFMKKHKIRASIELIASCAVRYAGYFIGKHFVRNKGSK